MIRRALLICLGLLLPLSAENLKDLPAWAQGPVQSTEGIQAPVDADAWILHKSLDFGYYGGGEIRIRERRVCRVLTDQGTQAGLFVRAGAFRRAGVKRLKGWNLRPDGTLTRVDKDDLMGFDGDSGDQLSTTTFQALALHAVVKGSLVVFESEQVLQTIDLSFSLFLLEAYPIRSLEIRANGSGSFLHRDVPARFEVWNAKPWIPVLPSGSGALSLSNLPAVPEREAGHPDWQDCLPQFYIRFEDPDPWERPKPGSWDSLASWYFSQVERLPKIKWPLPQAHADADAAADLKTLHQWILKEFRYQQVYLSPERGWIPEKPAEVIRKRYGDCKDLAVCLLASAAPRGVQGFPVLARIVKAPIRKDEPVTATAFNHLIAAVKLERSLGLPAEIETEAGRLLLIDCTARFTPLGWLPASHRKGRVMVCTPQKAIWIDIPDKAIEPTFTHISVKGELQSGGLQGTVEILEEGDDQWLRSLALFGDRNRLLNRIGQLIQLPATAKLLVTSQGDPLDLQKPFKVVCSLDNPTPLRRMGREYELMNLGFPNVSPLIQPKEKARVLPVAATSHGNWHLSIDLGLGGLSIVPSGPGRAIETPFRRLDWTSRLENGRLKLELRQRTLDAFWDFPEREAGVAAQRKDRTAMRMLLDDARALLPQQ